MLQGDFTLDDFLAQVKMIQKMGSLKDIVGKLPGMDQLPADVNLDDRELVKIEAMISSFTLFERQDPYALIREPGRVKRISKGSGTPEQAVSELVQRFLFMKQMMSNMGGMGGMGGLLGNMPGMKQLGQMKNLRKMMQGGGGMPGMGGFPGMPGMGGFPGMPGMGGFPGMPGMMPGQFGMPAMGAGGDSMTKMKPLSVTEKNAKKAQRKREKEARKKSRR
jgi:signal recognition particle subunit SRP54